MNIVDHMKLFFEPQSVAILGVSRKTGPGAFNILECLQLYGYQGKVYPVNPNAREILGIRCYPSVEDIRGPIELAVISLDRSQVLSAVESCVNAGIKALVIISQGFADLGKEAKILQDKTRDVARAKGARIVGPNTMGVVNNFHNFTTSSLPLVKFHSPVSTICQTGIFITGFYTLTGPVGKAIDLGNTCDVDFADVLEYYAADPSTQIIVLHIEGIQEGRKFLQAARKVTPHKVVLALKTGRTEMGAQRAASHSGSMAGKDFLYSAAFKQSGIIRAGDSEELSDLVKGFSCLPPPRGNRIALLTYTGGGGVMAVDRMMELNFPLVQLSPKTLEKFSLLNPPWLPLGNPLDMWPSTMKYGARPMYKTYLQGLLEDDGVDAVLCIILSPQLPGQEYFDVSDEIIEAATRFPDKPIVVWAYGPDLEKTQGKLDSSGRVVILPSAERAIQLLYALRERRRFLE
ncbi:MAG TPA: CoA-binding protein [Thermodesulfobacteriota bacterium]|nr:CoA-binding protein [Thermodesulfobacteriota bacterium]